MSECQCPSQSAVVTMTTLSLLEVEESISFFVSVHTWVYMSTVRNELGGVVRYLPYLERMVDVTETN